MLAVLHAPKALAVAALAIALAGLSPAHVRAEEVVNVYSFREPGLIDPILKGFTEKTGIAVKIVFSKDGLVERMVAEARTAPPMCC